MKKVPKKKIATKKIPLKKTPNKFPGLYREELKSGGKRYRILINSNKEIIQEYFYFRDEASEKRVMKTARARWRELREIYPVVTKRRFREIPRNTSSSGIIGVTRISKVVKGYEYEFWKASWTTLRGVKCSKQFSISKYGEKKAKRLALQTRQEALEKVGPK